MKKIVLILCLVGSCGFKTNAQRLGNALADVLNDDITSAMLEGAQTIVQSGGSSGDLRDASATLSNQECVPDFSQDLSSDITVSCNEEPSCEQCFATAFGKLNFYRRQLARMRCIYNNTKTYKDAAVAFGDNTSGIHAMAGIAWQKERANIMNTYKNMQNTYDRKSVEFLEGLQTTLRELDTCMYIAGENNWYTKSGFIYFEFMQERYKRTD